MICKSVSAKQQQQSWRQTRPLLQSNSREFLSSSANPRTLPGSHLLWSRQNPICIYLFLLQMCLQLAIDPKRHPSLQSLSLISSGFKEPNPLLFSLVCDLFYVWWLFDRSCFSCSCFSAAHNKYTTPTIIRYIVNCSSSFPSSYCELAMKQIATSQTILIIRLLPTKRQQKIMLIMFNTKEKMSTNGHDIVQTI